MPGDALPTLLTNPDGHMAAEPVGCTAPGMRHAMIEHAIKQASPSMAPLAERGSKPTAAQPPTSSTATLAPSHYAGPSRL
jgi:hypothetical protein